MFIVDRNEIRKNIQRSFLDKVVIDVVTNEFEE